MDIVSLDLNHTQIQKGLSESEAYNLLNTIFTGEVPQSDIETVLTVMADRGETVDEIVGFVRAMRESMVSVPINKDAVDLCGTGGTGKDRFNISTSVAFLLASDGVPVAKHGNRGSQKANGSFDFLEALGIPFNDISIEQIQACFNTYGLCFLFARNHHPAVRHVAAARKALGRRTIFNLIGPLCNPASVSSQIIGTPSKEIANRLAQVLQRVGTKRSLVIVGAGDIDELATEGKSILLDITESGVQESEFDPATLPFSASDDFGLDSAENFGGMASDNAILFSQLMREGIVDHPISDQICLNAGAAYFCFGETDSIKAGFLRAQDCIRSKKVGDFLTRFIASFDK